MKRRRTRLCRLLPGENFRCAELVQAWSSAGLYRLEVALAVFYGALLLVTPALSGLTRGRLPIEISTRGAKFAEEADQSATLNEEKIEDLERVTDNLGEELRIAKFEIARLKSQLETTHNRR